MNQIIFVEKVHTPGNAEHDIRAILQAGQPELPQEFFDSFATSVHQTKRSYLDVVGMTEWIVTQKGLADDFQKKFRHGDICESGLLSSIMVHSGEQLTRAVNNSCKIYNKIYKSPTQALSLALGRRHPPIVIEFKATNFKYTL